MLGGQNWKMKQVDDSFCPDRQKELNAEIFSLWMEMALWKPGEAILELMETGAIA